MNEAPKEIHKEELFFPYAPGKRIFVTEFSTARSRTRQPVRAAIFLPAAEYLGETWDVPVEGFSAPAMAAEHGFFGYTVDYVGMGKSYRPEDGSKVNYRANADAVRGLVDHIRGSRQVDRVDLIGEGHGGEVAAYLAGDPERIRSVVMSTVFYKQLNPDFADQFFSPQFKAFLRSHENGYFVPNFVPLTLRWTQDQEVRDFFHATQKDLEVPTGLFLQYFSLGLPIINAGAAKVPALIITPEFNQFADVEDMSNLKSDWGSDATLAVIEGGHHTSRLEKSEVVDKYFRALFGFLGR